jgi:hypothetical protein
VLVLVGLCVYCAAKPHGEKGEWYCSLTEGYLDKSYYGTYVFDKGKDSWDTSLMYVERMGYWDLQAQAQFCIKAERKEIFSHIPKGCIPGLS